MTPGAWGQVAVGFIAYAAVAFVVFRLLLWLLDRTTPLDEPEAVHPVITYPPMQDDADTFGA